MMRRTIRCGEGAEGSLMCNSSHPGLHLGHFVPGDRQQRRVAVGNDCVRHRHVQEQRRLVDVPERFHVHVCVCVVSAF